MGAMDEPPERGRGRGSRDPGTGRRPARADLHTRRAGAAAGHRVLPRRRVRDLLGRHARRPGAAPGQRHRRRGRERGVPARTRGALSGLRRGLLRRHAVDARARGRAGRRPGSADRRRRQRGWQPRRRRRADGERAEHATDHRPGARVPGHRRRLRRAVVHGERRGLLPRGDRDALVLGPLSRTRRRRHPPPCVTDPRERSVRLAGGSRDHGRVRPAARRGRGVRRRIGSGRRSRRGAALRRHDPWLREHADALSRSGRRGGAHRRRGRARRWVDHIPYRAGNRPNSDALQEAGRSE